MRADNINKIKVKAAMLNLGACSNGESVYGYDLYVGEEDEGVFIGTNEIGPLISALYEALPETEKQPVEDAPVLLWPSSAPTPAVCMIPDCGCTGNAHP